MKVVAQNRRARFDYEILETLEAGVMLTGPEVKSCRLGQISLNGSYVWFTKGVPILKNATIAKYAKAAGLTDYDPKRDRPLLLKGKETEKLTAAIKEKGVTVVPLEVRSGKFIKLLLALGRGRKKLDKRRVIRERETGRRLREGREE
jgi:SsrA-binding protein